MEAAAHQRGAREFASTPESIGEARDLVRDALAGVESSEEEIGDIQLAVSELVTNAVVHGDGAPITVHVERSERAIVCSVAAGSSGRRLPDPAIWTMPASGGPTGRGLAIVRAVADHVDVDIDESVVTVRCTFERR